MDNSNQQTQATRENHETLKVSTSSDPHHSPKMLLIGLATFLIIIVGGGIGYFLGVNNNQQAIPETTNQIVKISPTPLPTEASAKVGVDETANWKTYINEKFKYSFRYPSQWLTIDRTTKSSETDNSNSFYLNDNKVIQGINYQVLITTPDDNIEESKFFLNYGDAGLQNTAKDIIAFTIDGKNAYKAIVTTSEIDHATGKYEEIDKVYKILIAIDEDNTLLINSKLENQTLVDQILSTFQFIDS